MMLAFCRFAAVAVAAMALGMTAEAQSSTPCTLGVHNFIGFGMSTSVGRGGTAPPFSGTVKTTFEQKLADGNTIHATTRTHVARDSAGKTRMEFAQGCERGLDGELQLVKSVSVNDPALKTSMNWQVNSDGMAKVVRIFHQNETPVKRPSPAEQAERLKIAQMRQPPRAEFRTEDLGTRTINGIVAQGSRKVRTIAAGEEGNELPLEVVDETWTSRQMGLMLMIVRDDPRQGRTTAEFDELNLGEPDAAMFAVPEGYKVEEVHPNVAVAGVQ
jgi:hypothetical protein